MKIPENPEDESRKLIELEGDLKHHYAKIVHGHKSFYRLSDKFDSSFRKAAALCLQLNARPEIFIAALAHNIPKDKFIPPFVACAQAGEYYKSYLAKSYFPEEEMFDTYISYLKGHLLAKKKLVNILLNRRIDIAPWFRIVISKEPIPEVIKEFRQEALKQMTPSLKAFIQAKGLDFNRI